MCQALSMKQELHKLCLIIHEELMPACQHFPPLACSSLCLGCEFHPVCSVSLRLSLAITFSQPQKLGLVTSAYNFSTQEAKAGGSKFEVSLGCILKPSIR